MVTAWHKHLCGLGFFQRQLRAKKSVIAMLKPFGDLIEQFFLPFIIPTLIATVTAAVVYQNSRYTLSSYKYVLWTYGAYLLAFLTVKRYQKKALYLELAAGVISYLSVIIRALVTRDPGLLEVHELTYIFGMLLLFFCFYQGISRRERIITCSVCLLGVLLGSKRALWLALLVALGVYLVCRKLLKWEKKGQLFVGLVAIAVTFAWFAVIKYGIFDLFCDRMGVSDNSRRVMWDYFNIYYDLSPAYPGRGLTCTLVEMNRVHNLLRINTAISIHNEMLSMYIGWGFLPFLYFMVMYIIRRVRYLNGGKYENNSWIFLVISLVFLIINYFGSTMFNMGTSMVYLTIWTVFRDEKVQE